MEVYKKLSLTEEQKEVLRDFKILYKRMQQVGLNFAESYGHGLYAYNAKEVSCFDAPDNAAYDNEKEEIDITNLQCVLPFGTGDLYDHLHNDTKCLVAFL